MPTTRIMTAALVFALVSACQAPRSTENLGLATAVVAGAMLGHRASSDKDPRTERGPNGDPSLTTRRTPEPTLAP